MTGKGGCGRVNGPGWGDWSEESVRVLSAGGTGRALRAFTIFRARFYSQPPFVPRAMSLCSGGDYEDDGGYVYEDSADASRASSLAPLEVVAAAAGGGGAAGDLLPGVLRSASQAPALGPGAIVKLMGEDTVSLNVPAM